MTSLLHALPGSDGFDVQRQLAELGSVVASAAGSTYLAEAYTGWPCRYKAQDASKRKTSAR